ncbi:MAG TPA: hypothetical protein GXZ87_00540 [Bacteroidales bacterium]|nr:hypothetical protein [Bacteroidales bacterium]
MKKITLLFFAAMLGMSIMAQTNVYWRTDAPTISPNGEWTWGSSCDDNTSTDGRIILIGVDIDENLTVGVHTTSISMEMEKIP